MRTQGGYCDDFSRSNRAASAEATGLFPASTVAKHLGHGLTATLIKKFVDRAEYHHTSSWYNDTDYYDEQEVAVAFGLEPEDDPECPTHEANAKAIAALAAANTASPAEAEVLTDQTVKWIEWGGTRKHPKATERKAEGCIVTIKGQTATVTFPDGSTMVKRLTTNGFSFHNTR